MVIGRKASCDCKRRSISRSALVLACAPGEPSHPKNAIRSEYRSFISRVRIEASDSHHRIIFTMTSGTHFVSSSSSSPNCVRSLEAQLEAASLMSTPSSSPSSAFTKKSSNDTNDDPPKMMISWSLVRDQILQLTIVTGNLSSLFLNHRTTTSNNQSDKNVHNQLSPRIVAVLRVLWELSQSLHILLSIACQNKINLNNRKYPVDLCKVRDIAS